MPPAKAETSPEPPPPIWRKVRENAEAVIIAIILALIIRHYSLEAFEIPTGSMAPGLHGVHITATCPNCGTEDEVGIGVDQFTDDLLVRFYPGWIYEGPCPDCGLPIRDAVTQEDAEVRCLRCQGSKKGDPKNYRRVKSWARESVECHECTYRYEQVFEPSDTRGGHKILVNKFSYQSSPPERWQVIVFKFNRQRNYIKRLIGLPGETIQVIDGDIHINGALEAKPLEVQDRMWFPVHDSDVLEVGLEQAGKAWEEEGGFTLRSPEPGIEFNALDGVATLRYLRPIRNLYGYNGAPGRSEDVERVRDLRALVDVRFEGIDPAGSPALWIDIRNGDVVYRLALPIGEGRGEVIRLPAELAGAERLTESLRAEPEDGDAGWSTFATLPEGARLDRNRHHEVDFSLADRLLRVRLDGELILEQRVDKRDTKAGAGEGAVNGVAIRARRAGGVLERIRLFRDIHYTRPYHFEYAVKTPYRIPDDGYFAMGDNSPSSLDSRAWGALRGQNLLGRAFVVFWPALPWNYEQKFIR